MVRPPVAAACIWGSNQNLHDLLESKGPHEHATSNCWYCSVPVFPSVWNQHSVLPNSLPMFWAKLQSRPIWLDRVLHQARCQPRHHHTLSPIRVGSDWASGTQHWISCNIFFWIVIHIALMTCHDTPYRIWNLHFSLQLTAEERVLKKLQGFVRKLSDGSWFPLGFTKCNKSGVSVLELHLNQSIAKPTHMT